MTSYDEIAAHVAASQRTRARNLKRAHRTRAGGGGFKSLLALGKAGAWPLIIGGLAAYGFLPGLTSELSIGRERVGAQNEERIGMRTGTGYSMSALVVFPEADADHDYLVSVSDGKIQATAAVSGPYAYDPDDASIKITRPENVWKVDAKAIEGTYASVAPDLLKAVAGFVDMGLDVRASAEAQSFAQGLPLFRVSDEERGLLADHSVVEVRRSAAGFAITYQTGASPLNWVGLGLAAFGLFCNLFVRAPKR